MNEEALLDEYTKDEWFYVCRKLKPDLTWEDYSEMWDEFQTAKRFRTLN